MSLSHVGGLFATATCIVTAGCVLRGRARARRNGRACSRIGSTPCKACDQNGSSRVNKDLQTRTLICSNIFVRHGARYPTKKTIQKVFPNGSAIENEWPSDLLEQLSDVGKEQMYNLGWYMRKNYCGKMHPEILHAECIGKWQSSHVKRVTDSAREFIRGFQDAEKVAADKHVTRIPSDPTVADPDVYRGWCNKRYVDAMAALRSGDIFEQRGKQEKEVLRRIYQDFGEAVWNQGTTKLFDNTTYLAEVICCESFSRDTRIFKSLNRVMSPDTIKAAERLSHEVFSRRFFNSWGSVIGGRCLSDLLQDIEDSLSLHAGKKAQRKSLFLHNCHDYSILSLLSAIGVKSYPRKILGYGAYLCVEVWRADAEPNVYVSFMCNLEPFVAREPTVVRGEMEEIMTLTLVELRKIVGSK